MELHYHNKVATGSKITKTTMCEISKLLTLKVNFSHSSEVLQTKVGLHLTTA